MDLMNKIGKMTREYAEYVSQGRMEKAAAYIRGYNTALGVTEPQVEVSHANAVE